MQNSLSLIAPNFRIQEFVPAAIFRGFGEKAIWFVDPEVPRICQLFRTRFGKPVEVNNWHSGGQNQFRGYRPPDCAIGSKLSQHKRGNAGDISIDGISPSELAEDIQKHFHIYRAAGLTTIEDPKDTRTWLHFDCRWVQSETLLIVDP